VVAALHGGGERALEEQIMLLLVAQPTKQTVLNSGNSLSLPPSSWKSTMLNGLRECEVADAHARGSVDDRTIVTKKGEIGRMNKKDTVRQRSKSGVGEDADLASSRGCNRASRRAAIGKWHIA
jgi:hypothetical protein